MSFENNELRFNSEKCKGYKKSACCGSSFLFDDSNICKRCKEFSETQCFYCEDPCNSFFTFSGEKNKNRDIKDYLNEDE